MSAIEDVSLHGKSQQSLITQNLRASHEIISKLEQAKGSHEKMVDSLPDLFVVCDHDGRILNGNVVAAELFSVHVERLLWLSLSRLFCRETWNIFKSKILSLEQMDDTTKSFEFELPLDGEGLEERSFHWNIQILSAISNRRGRLFSCFGRDITQIRAYEKQLSQIFAAIPLGIVTIDSKGKIDGPYSKYTEYLLGKTELAEKSLKYELFEPSLPYMSKPERLGTRELFSVFGNDELWFDLGKDRFPYEFFYPLGDRTGSTTQEGRWLGLTYHPIVQNELVHKLLIVVEDRTEIVLARQREEAQRYLENKMIDRILDIQRCDAVTLNSSIDDMKNYYARIEPAWEAGDLRGILNLLHGIKGVARAAGFRSLKMKAHDAEDKLLAYADTNKTPERELIQKVRKEVAEEWQELFDLFSMLQGTKSKGKGPEEYLKDKINERTEGLIVMMNELKNALGPNVPKAAVEQLAKIVGAVRKLPSMPLEAIEGRLKTRAKITADQTAKKVDVTFTWKSICMDEQRLAQLNDVLGHIVTNAVDHGIEPEEVRRDKDKNPIGQIVVEAVEEGDYIHVKCDDDGAGINVDAVRRRALETNVVDRSRLERMSESEIMELIFHPGFSTKANQVTEISGRGIGLDSVVQTIKALGGTGVRVSHAKPHGSRFEFSIKKV